MICDASATLEIQQTLPGYVRVQGPQGEGKLLPARQVIGPACNVPRRSSRLSSRRKGVEITHTLAHSHKAAAFAALCGGFAVFVREVTFSCGTPLPLSPTSLALTYAYRSHSLTTASPLLADIERAPITQLAASNKPGHDEAEQLNAI